MIPGAAIGRHGKESRSRHAGSDNRPETPIERWHLVVESGDPEGLDALLADDVVFHSPVVHAPQKGRTLTRMYLAAAMHVLAGGNFRYVREIVADTDALLEFVVDIDGVTINGVDLIHWNADGLIDDFKVLIRPLKAIDLVHRKMGELLTQGA